MFERVFRIADKHESGPQATDTTPSQGGALKERIIRALRTVYDPEIPVNIFDLGLIYGIETKPGNDVHVRMTLTAPACPVAGAMPGMVEQAIKRLSDVGAVQVEMVWDPPWSPERMTDEARLELGLL
jgi:FeS assembly SUF system protein